MRLAFTHNLRTDDSEAQAEFDSPETVEAIATALESLGHEVIPVEVSGPASHTVMRLEALSPDLVFNTAEGHRGRFREAFFPGLFDQLELAYTGADAWACALTLDKQLTKLALAPHDIPMPRGVLIDGPGAKLPNDLRYPVILKPNYEGSSKGITQDSVVEDQAALLARLEVLLKTYPAGILVEEYIVGKDVVVPFLEAAKVTGGILAAGEYVFDAKVVGDRKWALYEYDLKQTLYDAVSVKVPADLGEGLGPQLSTLSARVFRALGIRDLGRIDFRLTPEGELYFIEVNALPSLEPGATIYESAALAGLPTMADTLGAVVESASRRWGLKGKKSRKRKPVRVGLAFNLKRTAATMAGEGDDEAEYDSPKTITALREALESRGHEVIELEATPELPARLATTEVDVVFNIAEGIQGRSREAQVPALLELMDIFYTGSDPATLSLTLDKALAKRVVASAGVATAPFVVLHHGDEKLPAELTFPAIVKPVAEGSSKGVLEKSVAETEAELRALARTLIERYHQPALAESFLTGREFTVGLLGDRRPKVLPPMEIVYQGGAKYPTYDFASKLTPSDAVRCVAPAEVDPKLEKALARTARAAFRALGCRDVARIDLRLDAKGVVNFIECNPLPGLAPGWSDLCVIAESAGMDYATLVGEILAPALTRLKARHRAARKAS